MKTTVILLLIVFSFQCTTSEINSSSTDPKPQAIPICASLNADQLSCSFNATCNYGDSVQVACLPIVPCTDLSNEIKNETQYRKAVCRYCHQLTNETEFTCAPSNNECKQPGVAISFYMAKCSAQPLIVCMGRRHFYRMRVCNHESGKKYGTAVVLSLFLGGLGADRFYLGMWREGLGKLFSFGGLGVWSVVDFFLVAVGYISPKDDWSYWNTVPSD